MLKLEDTIYGSWEADEVLEELILSAPMQRLKAVHQGGAIFLVDPSQRHTRVLGYLIKNFNFVNAFMSRFMIYCVFFANAIHRYRATLNI